MFARRVLVSTEYVYIQLPFFVVYSRMCPDHISHWPHLWVPVGVAVRQDLRWLWLCGHGWVSCGDCNIHVYKWSSLHQFNENVNLINNKKKTSRYQLSGLIGFLFLYRKCDYHSRRCPLGGGMVAGLPHRWHYHPHVCHSILVPA